VTTGTQTLAGAKTFSSTAASSVASGSDGFSLLQGARLKLNSGTDTSYIYADSSQYVHLVAKSKDFQFDEFGTITASSFNVISTSTSAAMELRAGANTGASFVGTLLNTSQPITSEGALLLKITNNGGSTFKWGVHHDGSIRFVGQTNASLPTCNAGRIGSVQYDTTNNKLVLCNGSAWQTITSS
jgi:hypothetical protein